MGKASRYAYLHARVSVLTERLLPVGALDRLIDCAPEHEAELLSGRGIVFVDPEDTRDPARLEHRLISVLLSDAGILDTGMTGSGRSLLLYWVRRFELGNLKTVIRGKILGLPVATVQEQMVELGSFASVDTDELLRTDDVAELLRLLEKTPYADIARHARLTYEQNRDLFTLDAAIDRRYFAGLHQLVNITDIEDLGTVRRLAGGMIDGINLVWLLRFRFSYGLAPAEAYYLLCPGGHALTRQRLQDLAQLASLQEVVAHLPPSLAALTEGAETSSDVEHAVEHQMRALARAILDRTAFALARTYAYLYLREKDLLHIHAVIKGKRLRLDPALIRYGVGLSKLGGIHTLPFVESMA